MEGWAITGSPVFWLAHGVLGRLHPAVGTLARPDLPTAIVADALRSGWRVQREAIECMLLNDCASALAAMSIPVTRNLATLPPLTETVG